MPENPYNTGMIQAPWEHLFSKTSFLKKNELPEVPGVYFFLGAKKEILYIGKATSLRDRVKSYFRQDLLETRGPKIHLLLPVICYIGYCQTDSVLEALLLEGQLIKKHQPPFNTEAKDDKSYNRVVITKEEFPRVLLVRDREIEQGKFLFPIKKKYGPFPSASDLRAALKIIRKLFPYRDTCAPYQELSLKNQTAAKLCFSAQIGLCPGVCMDQVSQKEYQKQIRHIELFFEGKKSKVLDDLEKKMRALAKALRFEEAVEVKKTIFGLQHIQDIMLVKHDQQTEDRHRIEGYDTAHFSGAASVGVMTVVQRGRANTGEYRQFLLRGKHGGNDISALREILERRLAHREWPLPEIMVIDGSVAQKNEAERVLSEQGLTIPVVSVVKDVRHKADHFLGPDTILTRFNKEILLVNSEAHRFALRLHKKRRGKEFLPTSS
jgi:excinuclease ABC subunit C